MIIATFNYGYNVTVKDSSSNPVWRFSTSSGKYYSKNLPAGTYTVQIGVPERSLTANVSADGLVGAVGRDTDFTLQVANPGQA